jgi:HAD superfamily hydrolase (TIGR01450 family)
MPLLSFVLRQKKVFLFDLDGTLYLGKRLLPAARELIEELRLRKKKLYFFTNNSSRSEKDYYQKLKKLGFDPKPNEVIMSTHTLILELKKRRLSRVFLLGTPAMMKMLRAHGISHTLKNPSAVVVGFDKTLTYKKLEMACRLVEKNKPYLVTHPDLFCPTDEGPEPDCGSFAAVIELVTKKKPARVLGKPNPLMVKIAKQRSHARNSEMILIGDRLQTDIRMGSGAGIDTIMVLTGDSKIKDLKGSKVRPKFIVPSVKDILRILKSRP